jgi:hypothetical protein
VNSLSGGTNGDCYCGNSLNFVRIAGLGTGMAPDNNCGTCNSGLGQVRMSFLRFENESRWYRKRKSLTICTTVRRLWNFDRHLRRGVLAL